MARTSSKKGASTAKKKAGASKRRAGGAAAAGGAGAARFELPVRAGLPALDSVIDIQPLVGPVTFAAGSGAAPSYTVITTNEVDGYEKLATSQGSIIATLAAAAAAPAGDSYKGKDRKAAKISIAKKATEEFADLRDLIKSLPPESVIINHVPPVTRSSTSNRVEEENRNLRVSAFLYAASRENDNDFHLIIGRDPKKSPELYMTMEISGLPPKSSASFAKLKAARDAYKKFFGAKLPGLGYDYYHPPIPVKIEGSLFFDVTHATGQRPGPKSLKSRMPVIWEIHPVTKIVF
jgi:hypothetical protein